MGLIRDALIGIALYEAVKYVLKIKSNEVLDKSAGLLTVVGASTNPGREESRPMEYSAKEPILSTQDLDAGLAAGADPETLFTGDGSLDTPDDTWKNSLANDELRAPDS